MSIIRQWTGFSVKTTCYDYGIYTLFSCIHNIVARTIVLFAVTITYEHKIKLIWVFVRKEYFKSTCDLVAVSPMNSCIIHKSL